MWFLRHPALIARHPSHNRVAYPLRLPLRAALLRSARLPGHGIGSLPSAAAVDAWWCTWASCRALPIACACVAARAACI